VFRDISVGLRESDVSIGKFSVWPWHENKNATIKIAAP
jgi:hypothetical protein